MNIFDHNSGDFKMIDLENFFEDIQKGAMDSGYELFMTHGISGMQKEMGSKDPISLANKLIQFYIRYEEYEKCIWEEVLQVSKSLDSKGKHFYSYGDKIEAAYNIAKNKNEKGYENKYLDKKRRSNKR